MTSEVYKKKELASLIKLPGNSKCADCPAPNPQWASLGFGSASPSSRPPRGTMLRQHPLDDPVPSSPRQASSASSAAARTAASASTSRSSPDRLGCS